MNSCGENTIFLLDTVPLPNNCYDSSGGDDACFWPYGAMACDGGSLIVSTGCDNSTCSNCALTMDYTAFTGGTYFCDDAYYYVDSDLDGNADASASLPMPSCYWEGCDDGGDSYSYSYDYDETFSFSFSYNLAIGEGWCYGGLDMGIGKTGSVEECFVRCVKMYGEDLVAVDWWLDDGGECYCQDECDCLSEAGDNSVYLMAVPTLDVRPRSLLSCVAYGHVSG
jgi:hypothetical protein